MNQNKNKLDQLPTTGEIITVVILCTVIIVLLYFYNKEGFNWRLYDYKFHPQSLKIDNTWANYYNPIRSYAEDGVYTPIITKRF